MVSEHDRGASPSFFVSNDELFTVREAMRELNRIITRIEDGEIEKAVLMRQGKMAAAVIPIGWLERLG